MYLLRGSADEGFGVQYGVQLSDDGGEIWISLNPSQQVIIPPFLFDYSRSLLGQHPNLLMAVLSVFSLQTVSVKHQCFFPASTVLTEKYVIYSNTMG